MASDAACRFSILLPSYRRCALLELTLASFPWDRIRERGGEVIVVDDGSADGTSDMVREKFPQITLIENPANIGLSQARNQAARAARGSLFLFTDNDVELLPGWIDAYLEADDGHTILAGRILDYTTGKEQGGPRCSTFLGKSLRCTPEQANVATGCNFAAPRAAHEAVGGFDEDIPYYFEERDYCIRARDAGYRVRYLPAAVLRHKGPEQRVGDAIRLQERHSVFAMLKRYRGQPGKLLPFSAGTALWLGIRLVTWTARGRFQDSRRLARGCFEAYRRFLLGRDRW